jgi:hypothetical protein
MKKKTVITTEKHEVWVIRQPGEIEEPDAERREPEWSTESQIVVPQDPAKNTRDNADE